MKVDKASLLLGAILSIALLGCQQATSPASEADEALESESTGSEAEEVLESEAPPVREATPSAARRPSVPSQPHTVTLAEGTGLRVRTTSALSTDSHQAGESFTATLEEPLVEGNWVIASKGATVEGQIVEADKGGRVQGVALLTIQLARLHTADGQTVEIATNFFAVEAESTKGKDATKIAIGTGIGAAIGAIAGGGKGAGIGAATGAGAGTGVVLATRGDAAVIESETVLDFELRSPVTITERS